MGTKQVETATVIGTITSAGGNATVVVTGAYISGSPVTVSVTVILADDASAVAGKIRSALAFNVAITDQYGISGTGADVVLTDHSARANDTTLNISIDNGTCTGLTSAPTSVDTTPGDGITNGYCTLTKAKNYLNSKGLTVDAIDDSVIEDMIGAASRYIDAATNETWYSTTATEYYDAPRHQNGSIFFDHSVTAITSVTNGDGSVIPSSAYVLMPPNHPLKYAMKLLPNSGYSWMPKNGAYEQAITIVDVSGIPSVPDDIEIACLQITVAQYKRRTGENTTGKSIITSGGVVVMPEDVPGIAADIINNHRKNAIG